MLMESGSCEDHTCVCLFEEYQLSVSSLLNIHSIKKKYNNLYWLEGICLEDTIDVLFVTQFLLWQQNILMTNSTERELFIAILFYLGFVSFLFWKKHNRHQLFTRLIGQRQRQISLSFHMWEMDPSGSSLVWQYNTALLFKMILSFKHSFQIVCSVTYWYFRYTEHEKKTCLSTCIDTMYSTEKARLSCFSRFTA